MKFAIIENGVVANLAMAREALADNWISATDDAQIGGAWDGAAFHPAPVAVEVPQSVEMWKARITLLSAGKISMVQPAIDAMPEPQKSQTDIAWNYATTVDRYSPFTLAIAPALGLDDAGMDALFIEAAKLRM